MTSTSEGNPFVGPRSIQPGETLPGRMAEVRDLFHRLQARRIVVLHSPSGAGKTSLVNAGLIPKLRESDFDVWKPIRVNLDPAGLSGVPPGTNRYLLSALLSLEEELPEARRRSPGELARLELGEYVLTRPRRKGTAHKALVLLFDQFEEVLTVAPWAVNEKRAFFRAVGRALENEKIWALFSVRADYLAALSPYRELIPTQLGNTFHLDLLGLEPAREAAEQLARQGGRSFPGAQRLVQDLSTVQVQQPDGSFRPEQGAYVEPVQLQVVCRRLWEAMPPGDPSIDYEDVAEHADVTKALAAYYAQSVQKVARGDLAVERALRDFMGSKLIVAGIRSQVRQDAGQSGGLDNALIAELLGHYLVRCEQRAGAHWYELSHDRLVLPVHADNEVWERDHLHPLQVQARMWEAAGRKPALLLSAEALSGAALWASENAERVTEAEREYLAASRTLRDQEARQRRRQRRYTQAIAAVAVVAVALAGYAWKQTKQAVKASREASESREVAQQRLAENLAERGRRALLEGDPEAAVPALVAAYKLNAEPAATRLMLTRALALGAELAGPVLMTGPAEKVNAARFSPDGKLVVTAGSDEFARVWQVAGGELAAKLRGHSAPVTDASFSPDGGLVATASVDHTARLWEAVSGRLVATLSEQASLTTVAFDASGTQLVTASEDGSVLAWDITDPSHASSVGCKGHQGAVKRAAFSQAGDRLITQGDDESVRIWSVPGPSSAAARGRRCLELRKLTPAPGTGFTAAALSPDGRVIATANAPAAAAMKGELPPADGTVSLWNASDGTWELTLAGHAGAVNVVAFSPDGKRLVSAGDDHTARVWSRHGTLLSVLAGHEDELLAAAFSPDGERVVTTSRDATARVWYARTGHPLAILRGHTDRVIDASFDATGTRLVSASNDGTARLWMARAGVAALVLNGHSAPVKTVGYSPDGSLLVSASEDKTARVWDGRSGHCLQLLRHGAAVNTASFSPDGERVVTASDDHTAIVWDPRSGTELFRIEGHASPVKTASFSRYGKRLITAGEDEAAMLWDAENGRSVLREPLRPGELMRTARFSPDGALVLTIGGAFGAVAASLWDAKTGALVRSQLGEHVAFADFSSDGTLIATGGRQGIQLGHVKARDESPKALPDESVALAFDASGSLLALATANRAKVHVASTLAPVAELKGHEGAVTFLAFSPSAPWLATVSDDRTVRVWDASAGTALLVFEGHQKKVLGATFRPDGLQLATYSDDMTIRLWNTALEARGPAEVDTIVRRLPISLAAARAEAR